MVSDLGQSLFFARNFSGAEREARRILGQDPEDRDALYLLARCFLVQLKLGPCRHVCEQLLFLDPEFSDGWIMLGYIELKNGLYTVAKDNFERALNLNPEDVEPHLALARLYCAFDQPKRAGVFFEQALVLNPDDIDLLVAYAQFLRQQGQPADELIERALEIAPDDVDVILLMGDLALAQGALREARERAVWVLQRDAENEAALLLLLKVRGRQNWLLGWFLRWQIAFSGLSFRQKAVWVVILLSSFVILQRLLSLYGPVWVHHVFVTSTVLSGGALAIGDAMMEILIKREVKTVTLKSDF